ncbi:6-pyruvoyl tetrahydropterin synthase family protein [Stella sp.]|uniref:6-pyruvoyl trahydropterin synthase family protein n=1 Tax=Stella sp. TaxID=2912054 RepID=UPI0035B1839D
MYAVTVSDHFMIAHSFRGTLFGPAQALHGATYAVEAELRRPALDANGVVCDIGRAMTALREVLAAFDYRNLDAEPDFAGINTTTEFLAAEIHRRLAARAAAGDLGPDTAGRLVALKVTLRESPRAWASFEGPIAAAA